MADFIVTQKQLEFIIETQTERFKVFQKNWNSFNDKEKEAIIEIYNSLYDKKITINEAWWNTIGDVVGIFDPTGIVDLINGIDYIRQGDYFFGFLSMIAIIPYVGDFVAKPIMGVSKGSKAMKGINQAMSLIRNGGNTAEASKILLDAGKTSKLFAKLLDTTITWAPKLKDIINKIPGGKLTGGLRKTLMDWIDLFVGAAKQRKNVGAVVSNFAKKVKAADPATATKLMKELETGLSKSSRTFRDYKITNPGFMSKYVWPGLSFRNRNLMALMRRTKFYAGLLDYLGVANFVGPEELSKQIGEENLRNKIVEYSNTKQGQEYWTQDMSSAVPEQELPPPPNSYDSEKPSPKTGDPFSSFLTSLVK